MYAIFTDGGRQYKVEEGQLLEIDYREAAEGSELVFDRVLAIGDGDNFRLGQPTVAGAKVTASVIGPTKGVKLYIQKMRRRKTTRRRTGHRQKYVQVKIAKIG
jgi:large subunit ribosomal protein L21